jgi:hypothetical protein
MTGAPAESAAPRRLAEQRLQANLAALAARQPLVAASLVDQDREISDLTWLFGRDGSLTARDAQGRWWGGSSLPLRVGRSLFAKLELNGPVGCLLAPATAGQIRAVLEKIAAEQAIIALLPRTDAALAALHCDDFSADIHAGRLWMVIGPQWQTQLPALLQQNPGLCVPQHYVRSGVGDEELTAGLIAAANPLLAAETARRTAAIDDIQRHAWSGDTKTTDGICVVAGSKFSLDDLAGPALAVALCDAAGPWARLDISRPTSASPLILAQMAQNCRAVVAADLYRADLPAVVPDNVQWVTWATRPRFAPPAPGSPADAVLLADESWRAAARAAGWTGNRLLTAAWPSLADPNSAPPPANGPITLIADAPPADVPQQLQEFSSHGVLWEQIRAELLDDPFAAGEDVDAYLSSRIARLDIDAQTLNRGLFLATLILPAWRRGVARRMIQAGLTPALFGAGWDGEFAAYCGGPITDLPSLRKAARQARAIVHPSPGAQPGFAAALGRPVARPHRALCGRCDTPAKNPAPPLSRHLILSLL